MLEKTPNVDFYQDMVKRLIIKDGTGACGVVTGLGHEIKAKSVVLTNGTFLMESFISEKRSLVEEEWQKKPQPELPNNWLNWDLKATGLKQERLQELMEEALIIRKWKNKKEMKISLAFHYLDIPKLKPAAAKKLLDHLYKSEST